MRHEAKTSRTNKETKEIRVTSKPSKHKGFSYDYQFIGTHGQVREEHEIKRYTRVMGFIGKHNNLRIAG